MDEYSITRTGMSANKWRVEGGLIAVLGLLLLLGVFFAGGGLLPMILFGLITILGWTIYNNGKIIRSISFGSPRYIQLGEQRAMENQPEEWETQRVWSNNSPQWQNQGLERRP